MYMSEAIVGLFMGFLTAVRHSRSNVPSTEMWLEFVHKWQVTWKGEGNYFRGLCSLVTPRESRYEVLWKQ
jgi:hypothetical protein